MNFLGGQDQAQWRTNVPVFSRLRFRSVWPGIAAEFYGAGQGFEYDLILSPGADPGLIQVGFDGTPKLDDGALILHGGFRQERPRAFQQGREIACEYVLLSHRRIGIRVGAYDSTKELVIDPVIVYATYLGGGNAPADGTYRVPGYIDHGNAIAVDAAGNAYIAGRTDSTDFPITPNPYEKTNGGGFIAKIDPTGTKLIYSTYFYGVPNAIAIDGTGAVYVAGFGYGTLFPFTTAAPLRTQTGDVPAFAAKLSADGSKLVYATYLSGTPYAMAVDASGAAYIAGSGGTGFPATPGAYQKSLSGMSDAFVTKINPAGTAFVYSTLVGGSQSDFASGIAVDATGAAYITGTTYSPDFPATPGAPQAACGCSGQGADAFVTKLSPDGAKLIYSTFLGGKNQDSAASIAIDSAGAAYVFGTTASSDFPVTAGSFATTGVLRDQFGNINADAFITKLDPSGKSWIYSTYLGGEYWETAGGITVDAAGTAYLLGTTASVSFPTTPDAFSNPPNSLGRGQAFLTRIDAAGKSLLYSTLFGGNGPVAGNAIALGPNNDVYITGSVSATDLPVTSGAIQPNLASGYTGQYYQEDAFIARFAFGDVSVSPLSLKIENLTPHSTPTNVALVATSYSGPRNLATSASSDRGWLSVPAGFSAPGSTQITLTPGGILPGTYAGSIALTAAGFRVVPPSLPVSLVIANFQASPISVALDGSAVPLRVTGGSGVYFSVTSSSGWLHTDLPAGVTPAALSVFADPTGLPSGSYTGSINLTPRNAPGDAISIPVTFVVP